MARKIRITPPFVAFALALFLLAVTTHEVASRGARILTFSVSVAFVVIGFSLANIGHSDRRTKKAQDTRTPEQIRADADAHTVDYDDMIAQGGDHEAKMPRTLRKRFFRCNTPNVAE